MLCLALLAGCGKDKIEEESPVPPEDVTLELSATDLIFGSDGGTQEFTISCNTDWTLTNESDWCTTDVTSGNGDRTVTVTVATSSETDDRNLNLSVTAGERTGILTVTEKHGNALIMAKDKFDLPQDGGDVTIDVKSDVEEVIIPDEYKSWITLAPDTRAAQIKCYVFIILEKKGKDGRRGYIIFKSGERSDTVFIFQAPEERLILSEDTCHVSSKGGDLTVELKTRIAYDVTIPSAAASWISQITEHSFRTDRLKLHIEADSIADRSAEIVIKNRYGDETDTLYIRQTAPQSPKEDITAAFDPAFAGLLKRRGFIPDSTRILIEDVQGIDSLDVSGTGEDWKAGKGLTSLAGIEYFESLTKLYCYYNQLTSLDVSQNTVLEILQCSRNQLTDLDVSKNTALTVLGCNGDQLKTLDISKNTALTELSCGGEQLTSLDVSKNTALTYLSCSGKQLKTLDVSKNTALTNLRCASTQLTSLDVSQNTALTFLYCASNQLTSLNVSNCTDLTELWCNDNQLTTLNINGCTALTKLVCYNNPGDGKSVFPVIAWFGNDNIPEDFHNNVKSWKHGDNTITINFQSEDDLQDITADFAPDFAEKLQAWNYIPDASHITLGDVKYIKRLQIHDGGTNYENGKGLTSLKGIEYFESLTYLSCEYNQLTSLDLSHNLLLTELRCHCNKLTSLDISKNTALTELYCGVNQLTELDVSKNPALTLLGCDRNQFTSLDVSKNTALIRLDCFRNQLTSLDVSNNMALTELTCYENQLSSLDVSNNTALTSLDCRKNQLTSLDVSGCTELTFLECGSNQLTSLDVSRNTALTELWCYSNQLTSLDVSNNTALTQLICSSNQLTSLDVSNNTALTNLGFNNNPGDEKGFFTVEVWNDYKNTSFIPDSWDYNGKKVAVRILNEELSKDVTADFDPDFAKVLQEKGYIPDATHITIADIKDIDKLDVSGTYKDWPDGDRLTSLKGIEYFESLIELQCNYNKLISLDVSKNIALKELRCSYNGIDSLDISQNTALTYLLCMWNQLTFLDARKNPALTELYCDLNVLKSLDVSGCTALTKLTCVSNRLTFLDVSSCTVLTELDCSHNSQLTSLDVSGCKVLSKFSCFKSQLTSLDVSGCMALTQLQCHENQLTSLDVSRNTALSLLNCGSNPGDGESLFPITAWFDNSNISESINIIGKSWTYDDKTITIDFRKAE